MYTDKAIELIENANTTQPFLMYLAYNAPHYPLQVIRVARRIQVILSHCCTFFVYGTGSRAILSSMFALQGPEKKNILWYKN